MKNLIIFLSVFFSATAASAQYYLVIGSYTAPVDSQGISIYAFDTSTGSARPLSVTGGISNPSYIAISKDGEKLYAVSEKDHGSGAVLAYRLDHKTGSLQYINQASSGGRGPCYISTDDAGTHVFTANYGSGSLGVIGLHKDGSLDTASALSIQHTGGSIDKENQSKPHAHSVVLSPDNRYLLCANLGNDHIYSYRYAPSLPQTLTPADPAYTTVTPGSGPRHICFHPSGNYVYVVNELAGSIDAFGYKDGALTHQQNITMLPEGFHGTIEAADIHTSPDGKFLYASNREERNELVIYSIDALGTLHYIARQSVLGAAPRNFVIDPTGKFLLVGNLKNNEVVIFRRDKASGLLSFTGQKISVAAPACLKFIDGTR